MITKEQNERLTRVGPGTPGGELLRRYWQPLCPSGEITEANPKKRIRIMGEDLLVFRDVSGKISCVEGNCPHRGVALYYGFLEDDGIRCCYHGWKFAPDGRCIDMPFEKGKANFMDRMSIRSYPVQKLGGLLFVYMGPDPAKAPLLPRWDVLAREDGQREVWTFPTHHCNWVQIQENTADSTHTYYLHGIMDKRLGNKHPFAAYYRQPIEKLEWEPCEWGIDKKIHYGGDMPTVEIRPPLLFPNVLRIPISELEAMHWRVPIDDTNTRILFCSFLSEGYGGKPMSADADAPFKYLPEMKTPDGEYDLKSFPSHDQMAMESQGPIYDRTKEHLGSTDRGIALYRKMLDEQIARVEQGLDPDVAFLRDPEKNRIISFESATSPVEGIARLRGAAE
jgi:5,5'-dehydrodivanillate O-demethylase